MKGALTIVSLIVLSVPINAEEIPIATMHIELARDTYLYGGARVDLAPILKRIIETKTCYSESHHAFYVNMIGAYEPDSFRVEKAKFDALYPHSPFTFTLLSCQSWMGRIGLEEKNVMDSVYKEISKIEPNCSQLLLWNGTVRHPATMEEVK